MLSVSHSARCVRLSVSSIVLELREAKDWAHMPWEPGRVLGTEAFNEHLWKEMVNKQTQN